MPDSIPTSGIAFRLPRDYQAILPEWVGPSRIEVTFEDDIERLPADSEKPVLYFIAPPADGVGYEDIVEPIRRGRSNAVIVLCTPRKLLLPTRTALLRLGVSTFLTGEDSASRVKEILAMAVARSDWMRQAARSRPEFATV